MKNKPCIIKKRLARQIKVEMMDGYIWGVNPKLIEAVDHEVHEERQRCFKKGDTVRILKNKTKDEMKDLYEKHGILWTNDVFNVSTGKI